MKLLMKTIKINVLNIMENLQNEFQLDFLAFTYKRKKIELFQNPFSVDINDVESDSRTEVIELQSNNTLKTAFKENNEFNKKKKKNIFYD